MTVYSNNIALYRNLKKNLNILSNFCIVHDYIGTLHGIMCKTYVDKETCLCLWSLYMYYNVLIYKKNRYDSITTCTATLSDICFGEDSKLITGLDSLGNKSTLMSYMYTTHCYFKHKFIERKLRVIPL